MTIMRRALKTTARQQFPPRTGIREKDRTRLPDRAASQRVGDARNAQRAFCGYLPQLFLLSSACGGTSNRERSEYERTWRQDDQTDAADPILTFEPVMELQTLGLQLNYSASVHPSAL
jgi:hypothetical protein